MKRSMVSWIPLVIVLVGVVFIGGYMLGNAMSAQAVSHVQEGAPQEGVAQQEIVDPFFTGTGWLAKPFQKILLERWNNLGPQEGGNCVLYRAISNDTGAPSFVAVASRLGELGVRHEYAVDAQVWVCGNVVHLPPSEEPPVELETLFEQDE